MATAYIQMDTPFALFVTLGKVETTKSTVTKLPPMYNEWNREDFRDAFLNEEFLNESAKNTESMQMDNYYASIIETALDELLG